MDALRLGVHSTRYLVHNMSTMVEQSPPPYEGPPTAHVVQSPISNKPATTATATATAAAAFGNRTGSSLLGIGCSAAVLHCGSS